ncbi:methyl-accepting chemotaxis protein [Alteromonas sp. 14N.309.X.WAT.G.H12]|uniref:methyl-accepting chemotaxis protein n=1 Tax=Alteromonas sp. 14N.309.X.WAT.G.H12 TaxID=3120824 RepID=UPI002FCF0293
MFSSLRVSHRLFIGFGLIIAMLITVTVLGIGEVGTVDHKMTIINDVNSVKQRYAINFRGSVHDRAIAIRDVVLQDSMTDVNETVADIERLAQFYRKNAGPMDAMMKQASNSTEKDMLQRIKAIEKRTLPLVTQIIQLRMQDNLAEAQRVLLNDAKPAFVDWLAAINAFIDYQEEQNQGETELVREATGAFTGIMITATAVATLIALVVIWLLIAYFKRQLGGEPHYIAGILQKMANGQLGISVESSYSGSVLHSVRRLQQQLVTTIEAINTAAENIRQQSMSGNENDNAADTNLDTLAAQQSSQSQQVIHYMTEVKDKADLVGSLLTQTEEISNVASTTAGDGQGAVTEASSEIRNLAQTVNLAVDNIRKLEKRTQEISGITNTISAISEQTNLLALNAAIEAARAGESGRGFAVVADEVRNLASRTGEATAEISSMLNEVQAETSTTMEIMSSSLPQVERGIELSDKSRDLLQLIAEQAERSLSNVSQVVNASSEQISTLGDLNEELNEVITTATTMSDASLSLFAHNKEVAQKLSQLASELKHHADYFSTK